CCRRRTAHDRSRARDRATAAPADRAGRRGSGRRRPVSRGPRWRVMRLLDSLRSHAPVGVDRPGDRARPSVRYAATAAVFALALGVRLLYATEAIGDVYGVEQERYRIAHFYHEAAASLAEGDDRVAFPHGLAPE